MDIEQNVCDVVAYLNLRADKQYRPGSVRTHREISARLREGYTVDELKLVIDRKVKQWGRPPTSPYVMDMRLYLRPSTLFGHRFEDYLNEPDDYVPMDTSY